MTCTFMFLEIKWKKPTVQSQFGGGACESFKSLLWRPSFRSELWAEMKLNVLLWVVALLGAFLPRSADCRPVDAPTSRRLLLPQPLLLRLGEEFSLRLDGGSSSAAAAPDLSSSSSAVNQALLQLTQRLLQALQQVEEAEEKEKRSDEPPISLDLTFHLLREVLEMARAEQIAQQADSNRRMMDTFGKWSKSTNFSLPVEYFYQFLLLQKHPKSVWCFKSSAASTTTDTSPAFISDSSTVFSANIQTNTSTACRVFNWVLTFQLLSSFSLQMTLQLLLLLRHRQTPLEDKTNLFIHQ